MPYKRKYRSRPGYAACGSMVAKDASKALSMAKALKGLVNSELHVHDTVVTSSISSTGTVTSLSGVAQSDDISGRTGRSILCKSLQIKSTVATSATATATRIRTILFVDNQNQGSTPNVADVLKADGDPEELRNVLTEQGRFRVLYDSLKVVDPAGTPQVTYDKFIDLGNHHIYYEGTGAANVGRGSLWMLRVSNETSTEVPGQNTNIRIRFYDN